MTDAFEAWINNMSDDEYDEMLDDTNPHGFTDKQEEKALNIRSPPTKEEQQDLDELQEFNEQQELDQQEESYREEKRKQSKADSQPRTFSISEGITEIEQPVGEPITIRKTGERVTMSRAPRVSPLPSIPSTPPIVANRVIPPSRPAMRSFRTSINNAVKSASSFVRRFFRL